MSEVAEAVARWRGTWRNELGSLLRIADASATAMPGGSATEHLLVSGAYQTAKGSVPLSERFPVRGFVTGDQIAFSVSFRFVDAVEVDDGHHTLAAWAGQILPVTGGDRQQLRSLWHLVPDLRGGDAEDEYGWVVAWSGEDRFDKLSDDPAFESPAPPTA